MDLETTLVERAVHLALFLTAGIAAGLAALSLLERLVADGRRVIRPVLVGVAGAGFLLFFVAERLYHAL